jgi:hypothetical protein
MTTKHLNWGIALAAGAFALMVHGVALATACEKSALRMFSACHFDASEEQKATVANCFNISNAEERRTCKADASEALPEDRASCRGQREARIDVCELLGEFRYDPDPLEDPSIEFVDMDEIGQVGGPAPNPYFNLTVGRTFVLRAGEEGEETVVVYVTDETAEVNGHDCRIVVDAAVEEEFDEEEGEVDYEPAEFTDDLYLQDTNGDVYYCGEVSRNFEDGILDNLDGSFRSGVEFAKGGVLIRAFPTIGESHRQEYALGEAEDLVTYVDDSAIPGEEVEDFPCAPMGCLQTLDQSPLEPESTEFKYYVPNVGFVLAEEMEDGELTGEREELVCVGDSLDILFDLSCGIENPQELLEDLCDLASQFCSEDDD